MKTLINDHDFVKEMLLTRLRAYLYELSLFGSDYVSTEAYNGVEHSFIYHMSISIRNIVETETNSHSNAIFLETNSLVKRIDKSKIESFLKKEISNVEAICGDLIVVKLKEYAEGFAERASKGLIR